MPHVPSKPHEEKRDDNGRFIWGETPKTAKRKISEDGALPKAGKRVHRSLNTTAQPRHAPKRRPRHWGTQLG